MNSQTLGLRVGGIIFGVIALVHAWRLFTHFTVQIGSYQVPLWGSGLGLIIAGALSIWLLRLSARSAA